MNGGPYARAFRAAAPNQPAAILRLMPVPAARKVTEDSVYRELKTNYRFDFPIFRPRYLPPGFRIAPYYSQGWDARGRNPLRNPSYTAKGREAAVAYWDGKKELVLKFAMAADVGDIPGIQIGRRTVYFAEDQGNRNILWYEKGYLYAVSAPIPKGELLKVFESLKPY